MTPHNTVADFMVTDIVTLPMALEINHAVSILLNRKISGAPVLDDMGELAGILTKKDCFKAALNANYYKQWGGTVADYMTAKVVPMDADLDIVSAAEMFLSQPYRLFPVLAEGQLAGLISRSDLLRAFIDTGKP